MAGLWIDGILTERAWGWRVWGIMSAVLGGELRWDLFDWRCKVRPGKCGN